MDEEHLERQERPTSERYTGIVCRRCYTPVAHLLDDDTAHCPRCGHQWELQPPVRLEAA